MLLTALRPHSSIKPLCCKHVVCGTLICINQPLVSGYYVIIMTSFIAILCSTASLTSHLQTLECPYTESADESWIVELLFTAGEPRIRILVWLLSRWVV